MTQICIVPECTHSAQKVTKLTSKSAILRFFTTENTEDSDMSQSSDSTNEGVPLCAEHYGAWYRSSHPSHIKCKTCGKTLIDISKSRPYPQPSLIHNVLRENTDFSGEIGPNDRACYTCYKSHLITIKHINHTAQSIKQDLGTLLTKIKESLPDISNIQSIDGFISYTCNIVAIHVGEALLKDTALLLPEVNEIFNQKI